MTTNALIAPSTQMPAHLAALGAIGNENIGSGELATPRLYLLQALSEQVIKGSASYVKGATAGNYINSLTNQLFEELFVANLFMTRVFNVNKKRIFGQDDWRGTHNSPEEAMARLDADGVNPADYDIADTHVHTLAVIDAVNGTIETPIQLSMKATGLKESRAWNSNIITIGGNVPRFASVWKLGARLNTNNKGSWYVPQVAFAGWASKELLDGLNTLYQNLRGTAAPMTDAE